MIQVDGQPEDFGDLVVKIAEVADDLRRFRHRTCVDDGMRTTLAADARRLRRFANYMEQVADL